jgi:hypothetical protein
VCLVFDVGALFIRHWLGLSDADTVEQIRDIAYMRVPSEA